MSEPFLGQIQLFAFPFAPRDWAFCHGQILPVPQNPALASLLGNAFGGDGIHTFGLPDFRGRVPGGQEAAHPLGKTTGSPTVTLKANQIPAHAHAFQIWAQKTASKKYAVPQGNDAVTVPGSIQPFTNVQQAAQFNPGAVQAVGGQPHENQQPYLALNFCIALTGIYPENPDA